MSDQRSSSPPTPGDDENVEEDQRASPPTPRDDNNADEVDTGNNEKDETIERDEQISAENRAPTPRNDDRDEKESPPRKKRRSQSKSPVRIVKSTDETQKKEPNNATSRPEATKDLRSRTGGAYIPPAKLRMMQEQMKDKDGVEYQKMNWERLKKKINGLVNKVNVGNLVQVVRELLQENVIRGKGLLCRSIIQAQSFSPGFSHVFAALVAVINSKFPHIGDLLLRRLIVQFKRSFRRNDRGVTVNVVKFIAHLINQQVSHELLALEIMILMLEEPTDDSVEIAIAFLKECGSKLSEVSPVALDNVRHRLLVILMETRTSGTLDKRIQYMIEVTMQVFKDKFKAYPAVIGDLDLIEEEDQITHTITLEDATDPENQLNVFKFDPEFQKNESVYEEIRNEIIGDADISSGEEEDDEDDEDESDQEEVKEVKKTTEIIDNTEQNLVAFRREIYLTLQSSLDFQEAAHKLLKMGIKPEMETELCNMLVDCCTQQRTYERFYGMLIERFCRLRLEYQQTFEQICRDAYTTVHRFDITKLRNLARLVSHLLFTDAIEWNILSDVKMTEEDTTSSGRIFIRYIFQELSEVMGIVKLYERVKDPTLAHCFSGLFPRDNPQNARFAINFFTMIGLGGLTLDLREWLEKGMKKKQDMLNALNSSDSDSSSSSSSSESDSDSSSDSDSDSDSDSSSSDSASSVEMKKTPKKLKEKKEEEVNKHKSEKKSLKRDAVDDDRKEDKKSNNDRKYRDEDDRAHRKYRDEDRENDRSKRKDKYRDRSSEKEKSRNGNEKEDRNRNRNEDRKRNSDKRRDYSRDRRKYDDESESHSRSRRRSVERERRSRDRR